MLKQARNLALMDSKDGVQQRHTMISKKDVLIGKLE
jgi:hypothetical protein